MCLAKTTRKDLRRYCVFGDVQNAHVALSINGGNLTREAVKTQFFLVSRDAIMKRLNSQHYRLLRMTANSVNLSYSLRLRILKFGEL